MKVVQHSRFISDVLKSVFTGFVAPAGMQRPYVWSKQDVEALFDSILQEFPIGSFLSWMPKRHGELARIGKKNLGPIALNSADTAWNPRQLLLDGQNRLATLAWVACKGVYDPNLPYSEAERAVWMSGESLVYDGESQSVRFVPDAEAKVGLRLPAWCLMSLATPEMHREVSKYMRELMDSQFSGIPEHDLDCLWHDFDCAQRAFQRAKVIDTVIEDATPEEARRAFIRICRAGVPMAQEDFDYAMSWTPGQAQGE